MGTRVGAACIVALVVALTGCGGDGGDSGSSGGSGLDTAEIESTLESNLGGSGSSLDSTGPAITDVSCPDEVEAAADTSFDCTLAGDGGLSGDVTVTIKDEAGSEIEYEGSAEAEGFTQEINGNVTAE
jgi:hypothetical protein